MKVVFKSATFGTETQLMAGKARNSKEQETVDVKSCITASGTIQHFFLLQPTRTTS
jgi:hypothetical protein